MEELFDLRIRENQRAFFTRRRLEAGFRGGKSVFLDKDPVKCGNIVFITRRVRAFGYDKKSRKSHRIT
ncbi:MAG TPA: hypothetical protein DEQ54_05265 [Firmicutes bacterium]|nr:hypothetical protein [Bacillota bacterium]HCD42015.1 hypothetical protein [Bacillota bacterium]